MHLKAMLANSWSRSRDKLNWLGKEDLPASVQHCLTTHTGPNPSPWPSSVQHLQSPLIFSLWEGLWEDTREVCRLWLGSGPFLGVLSVQWLLRVLWTIYLAKENFRKVIEAELSKMGGGES